MHRTKNIPESHPRPVSSPHHSPGDGTGQDHKSFKGMNPWSILDHEPPGDGDYRGNTMASPDATGQSTGRNRFADEPRSIGSEAATSGYTRRGGRRRGSR